MAVTHASRLSGTPAERIERLSIPEPNSGCTLWFGAGNKRGYGHIKIDGRQWAIHRFVWTMHHGLIPSGMYICHRCDMPPCINIDHLFVGTPTENVHDMMAKGRSRSLIGSGHQNSILTEEKVAAIRCAKGTQAEIAERFGVHEATVWGIIHRKRWTHIP